MGGKRKDPEEIVRTVTINLKQKVLTEIEKHGKPKKVIEEIIIEKFSK